MRLLLTGVCLLMSMVAAAEDVPLTLARARELGRKYTAALYANDAPSLWTKMTEPMQESLGTVEKFKEFNLKVRSQMGAESKVLREVVVPNQQYLIYTRLAEFEKVPGRVVVQFTFSADGKIAGFFVMPEPNSAESHFLQYKDKAAFRLPLSGEWTVYQGGRTVSDNYHAAFVDQRFAYDFMVIKGVHQYDNKGWELSDFYSFGQPILAPAAGKVVSVVDQYDDNPPLRPNKDAEPQGNNIVIDHGNGEFSMLAHLKRGSVKVKAGDTVTAGQAVALCGNSGNSPFPHLHYHLQTTPQWLKGEGLPIQFHDYLSNGAPVAAGEPVRGDVVQSK